MANNGTIDFSNTTMDVDGTALINALLPKLITALANNPALLSQLTNAVTKKMLTSARSTGTVFAGYAGGTKTAAASKINTNAIPR